MEGPRIEADLQLASAADGGRSTAIESGYRSLARFGGTGVDLGFELLLGRPLAPGRRGSGILTFWAELRTEPGHHFEIREGTKVVGTGTVRGPA